MKTSDLVYMLRARDNDVVSHKAADKIEELQAELTAIKAEIGVLLETSKISREIRSITKEVRELNS